MVAVRFDSAAFKRAQRADWNAVSPGWEAWQDRFEAAAAPVTARLLRLAGVRPGHRVLDVGTGLGEPALTAARLVGPTGSVVGVDLAPEMLARARRRAGPGRNVTFIEGDVETLDLPLRSFDVVLSRWGLMFAVDHLAAFRVLHRLLVRGGVLAAAVWGPPAANPLTSLGYATLSRWLELPAPPAGTPGPFSMSDPAQLIDELTAAGFSQVSVTDEPVQLRLASISEFVRFTQAVVPPGLRARIRGGNEQQAWAAVAAAAAAYVDARGEVALPGRALCLRAVVDER